LLIYFSHPGNNRGTNQVPDCLSYSILIDNAIKQRINYAQASPSIKLSVSLFRKPGGVGDLQVISSFSQHSFFSAKNPLQEECEFTAEKRYSIAPLVKNEGR
jgi:hypothetical protein